MNSNSKVIVLTGKMSRPRGEISGQLSVDGFTVSGKVDSTTDIVFATRAAISEQTTKIKQAARHRVPVADENVLDRVLQGRITIDEAIAQAGGPRPPIQPKVTKATVAKKAKRVAAVNKQIKQAAENVLSSDSIYRSTF